MKWDLGNPITQDLHAEPILGVIIKGSHCAAQFIYDATKCPNVSFCVVGFATEHLWRRICYGPDELVGQFGAFCFRELLGDSKVSYGDIVIAAFQEDVTWLQVCVYYTLFMDGLQAQANLDKELPDTSLLQLKVQVENTGVITKHVSW